MSSTSAIWSTCCASAAPGTSGSTAAAGASSCPRRSPCSRSAGCASSPPRRASGSGKSSLTDELVRRFRVDQEDKLRIAVIAVDPTRRKGGGALLGDRIRMNSLTGDTVYFRSLATRGTSREVPEHLDEIIGAVKA